MRQTVSRLIKKRKRGQSLRMSARGEYDPTISARPVSRFFLTSTAMMRYAGLCVIPPRDKRSLTTMVTSGSRTALKWTPPLPHLS